MKAGVLGILLGAAASLSIAAFTGHALCSATDGDTIRCGAERIRLNGIDAPEMPGHCRVGRACVPGDPYASKRNLARLLSDTSPTISRLKTDRYGRTVANVSAGGIDLSCAQLRSGYAVYKARWDEGRTLAAACGR